MNRFEQEYYADMNSIAKSLEKIANALDTPNVVYNGELKNTKDIPGFEGVLNDLDNISLDYLNAEDKCKAEAEDTYDNDLIEYLDGIKNDSDYDIRVAASNFEEDYTTKKDAILDYVDFEFGSEGAKYTDIIKFAYYLGAPNASK